jgi:hypothetical protein
MAHLGNERLTTVGERAIYDAIVASTNEYTRQLNEMMAGFVVRTSDHKIRYYQPGSGTLQPLDEYGNPVVVKPEGYYDVAFPIQGGGTAFGNNRVTRALMTVAEANRATLDSLRRDADWMRRHMLAAVFDNVAWTYSDPEYGNLTVEALANSDTVTYVKVGGATATDTHYLAQASAIDDSNNPFDDIYDELMEHAGNMGPVVVYVPSNLTTTIEALTAFVDVGDPDIRYGTGVDQIQGGVNRGFGDEVLGKCNKCWIVEWRALPDSYMIGWASGQPVLGMREYPAGSLQGFFPENHSPDGNLQEMRMIRYAGFGVMNRAAALAYRIGNASYAIPTGYNAPLGV